MSQTDILYRAFLEYKKLTADKSFKGEKEGIKNAESLNELLEAKVYVCKIENDWIEQIEEGLKYVSEAIAEAHQFIRSDGEVVPIEKIKKVSKASVEHLAKHSNFITRLPKEGEEIIPDKIYFVEKLTDFAVYENRFLYMLLCYLRNFIEHRLSKIKDITATFKGNLKVDKLVNQTIKKSHYNIELLEERKDNPLPLFADGSKDLFNRIEDCQHLVNVLLETPLMIEVSKAPMLKPPIVKTNVLRMNNKFKHAVALYEYLSEYTKPGYEANEVVKKYSPFTQNIADDVSEVLALMSFVTFLHGNGLSEYLKQQYDLDEDKRRKEEQEKLIDQIKALKRRITEEGLAPFEYMLLLEKRNKELEKDSEDLKVAQIEITNLKGEIEENKKMISSLSKEVETLTSEIEKMEEELKLIEIRHQQEIDSINLMHEQRILSLDEKHKLDLIDCRNEYDRDVEILREKYELEISEIEARNADRLDDVASKYEDVISNINSKYESDMLLLSQNHNDEIEKLNARYNNAIEKFDIQYSSLKAETDERYANALHNFKTIKANYLALYEEKYLLSARLNSVKPLEKDYTTKEGFAELEKEYAAFTKFFDKQWSLVKKKIRKEVLWKKEKKDKE